MVFKNFGDFWRSLKSDSKRQLAQDARTDYTHLSNVASKKKKNRRGIGIDLAERLRSADSRITIKMITNTNAEKSKAKII